jgi:hypothetical protein
MFETLIAMTALIAPSLLSSKGKGTRGAWIALAIASAPLSLIFGLVWGSMSMQKMDGAGLAGGIFWMLFSAIFGGVFAACFFKPAAARIQ